MRAVVVYESMFGNTHLVAEAIAEGLRSSDAEVSVLDVLQASSRTFDGVDLVVVGGPTHAHSMSRPTTRHSAREIADKDDNDLVLEPDAEGPGLREWFDALSPVHACGAAFDTRIDVPPVFSGRASKGIAKRLRRHGVELVAPPESFLVQKDNHLQEGEAAHARSWGGELATSMRRRAAAPVR